MGLYSVVLVATAAKHDLTTNIVVTDGLSNGAECVIQNIDYRVDGCQGDTLDEAVVGFPGLAREHMHYVGLSPVRNNFALHILNLNENKIKVSEKVKNEMSRLRTEATLCH